MLTHYIKIAFRNIARYKTPYAVSIAGLVIGFTAFALGGYWWHWESRFDNFHPDSERIFAITTCNLGKNVDGSDKEHNQLHKDVADYFIQAIPEIESHTSVFWLPVPYAIDKEQTAFNLQGLRVDNGFFAVFQADFLGGGIDALPFDDTFIVLTEKTANRLFGSIDCVGETVQHDGQAFQVAGVIRDYPTNTNLVFDMIVLSNQFYNNQNRSSFYIKLKEHVDAGQVAQKIEGYQAELKNVRFPFEVDEAKEWHFKLRTLSDLHFKIHQDKGGRFRTIQLFAFAGLFAMIAALLNYLVFFIGLQQKRRNTLLTLNSLGASTRNHLIGESLSLLLPLLLAFVLTLAVIHFIFPYYQSYAQFDTQIEISRLYDYFTAGFLVVFVLVLFLHCVWLLAMVKRLHKKSSDRLKKSLIIAQVFIGSFFFFISLTIYKQFLFMQDTDKGIRVENITQIHIGFNHTVDTDALAVELRKIPAIEDVTFTHYPVLAQSGEYYGNFEGSVILLEDTEPQYATWNFWVIEENFFRFFDIRLKEGDIPRTPKEIIINETGAQHVGKEVTGKEARASFLREVSISGVAQDYHYAPMQFAVSRIYYGYREGVPHLADDPYRYLYIKVKPGSGKEVIAQTVETIRALGRDIPEGDVTSLSDFMKSFTKQERILFIVFSLLSFTCILIVSFGIYSLVNLAVEQRKKEVAIRKINGATLKDIILLFIREYLLLVIAGNLLALPVGYLLMKRWLETYAFHTSLSVWLFIIVFLCTCLVVLLAIFEKIRIAAKENPAEALKN